MKDNLTKPIHIRVTPKIYQKIHDLALARGMKVSQFVRHLIAKASERKQDVEK